MFYAIKNYLEAGGRLYIEGADVVAWDLANYFPLIDGAHDGHEVLWPLLGIASATDGSTNVISELRGQSGPTSTLLFTASNQTNNDFIDLFQPLPVTAVPAFIEDDYGIVGIVSAGAYAQRSFVFSYALSELIDARLGSIRLDFLDAVVDFYEAEEVTLPVSLSSFNAIWQDAALLQWVTASETELLGWNVFRAETTDLDAALKLNVLMIPSAGEVSQGAHYSFKDGGTEAGNTYYYWLEAVSYTGDSEVFGYVQLTAPLAEEEPLPEVTLPTELLPGFPNPFNSRLVLPYRLKDAAMVQIDIYDLRGRKLRSFQQDHAKAGSYTQVWDGKDAKDRALGSGLYIIRMKAGSEVFLHKVMLMK
jgi:hypothetical protein